MERKYQICTNCVMDTSDSRITFDSDGVCDHCNNFFTNVKPNWRTDERGRAEIEKIVANIKKVSSKNATSHMAVISTFVLFLGILSFGIL